MCDCLLTVCAIRDLNVGHMWIPRWTGLAIFHVIQSPEGGVVYAGGVTTCLGNGACFGDSEICACL